MQGVTAKALSLPPMGKAVGALQAFFRDEMGALPGEAQRLAELAREVLQEVHGEAVGEDPEEDLCTRLQGPWAFGHLAARSLILLEICDGVKDRLVHRAFDIIPLPEEMEVFPLEDRVPGGLQEIVHWLLVRGQFTSLHFLHLLYGLFLRPDQAALGPASVVAQNLAAVVASPDQLPEEKALMALLTATSREEGAALLSAVLRSSALPPALRHRVAEACLFEGDLGVLLRDLCRRQGLLPKEGWEPVVASLDAEPSESMRRTAKDWLRSKV